MLSGFATSTWTTSAGADPNEIPPTGDRKVPKLPDIYRRLPKKSERFSCVGVNVRTVLLPNAEPALRYFHIGRSVGRGVNDAGLKQRRADDADSRIRMEPRCALAPLSPEKAPAALESIEVLFQDDEIELARSYESNCARRHNPRATDAVTPDTNRRCGMRTSGGAMRGRGLTTPRSPSVAL